MTRMLARLAGWLLAVVIVILSIVPPQDRPVLAPHVLEHAAIFAALGVAFALAYPRRDRVALALLLFCGAVEWAQVWMPGRHARLSDLLVDSAAALAGVAAVALAAQFAGRRTKRPGALRDNTSS